jgi:hypothetical protein
MHGDHDESDKGITNIIETWFLYSLGASW